MQKNDILSLVNNNVKENMPTILTSLGVVGLFTSIGLTVKSTKEYMDDDTDDDYKKVIKHYSSVMVVALCSVGCIVGSNSVSNKRNLALVGAYKLSESNINKYKDKLFGNVKKTNEDVVEHNVSEFGDGNIDCYDQMSGRYFKSDLHTIRDAVDEINKAMYYGDNGYLNDFYSHLGMNKVDAFEHMAWICDGGPIGLQLSSKLSKSSKPVLVVDFYVKPICEMVY